MRTQLAEAKADRDGARRGHHRCGRQGVLRRRRPRHHGRRRRLISSCTRAAAVWRNSSRRCGRWASRPSPACTAMRSPAGFGLALACDIVIAADNAVFGTPEIDVGLWPYMITVPLTRSMPPKKALELMMTGRRVDAAEADRMGFVTRVVPVAELDAAVAELANVAGEQVTRDRRSSGRDSFYEVWDRVRRRGARVAAPAAHSHDADRRRAGGHRRVQREAAARMAGFIALRHTGSGGRQGRDRRRPSCRPAPGR